MTALRSRKKSQKIRPSYWRLTRLLKRLCVVFREIDRGTEKFHIVVPLFGIVFRFNKHQYGDLGYTGWDIIDVNLETLEIDDRDFGEQLVWLLISKGYLAYLREGGPGLAQVFRNMLVQNGWAEKIFDKRAEYYKNEPRNKFLTDRNNKFRTFSVHQILTHHPNFFDYLY